MSGPKDPLERAILGHAYRSAAGITDPPPSPEDPLRPYLDEVDRLKALGVSVEAVLLHLLSRSDMSVQQTMGILGVIADSMPDLVQLLDETNGWTRMQQRRSK